MSRGLLPTDAECLEAVTRLRLGTTPCPACGATDGYSRQQRHRAVACRACGHKLFPCEGTPFAKAEPPLRHWFAAIDAAAGGMSERELRRTLAIGSGPAARLLREANALRATSPPDGQPHWFEAISGLMSERRAALGAAGLSATRRETPWQTLRAMLAIPEFERRPLLGIGAIAGLTVVGAGIGWVLVPAPPAEDSELEQASAILSLGEDKPVILVTAEVAAQLYDVSDVDAVPNSPLASTIKVTSGGGDAASAKPMTAPSIKLSDTVGKQLLAGNTDALKAKGSDRPELAAYKSLAAVLDTKGNSNPDEILIFGPMKIRRYLVDKIVQAAKATQVDPVLLMAIADKESAFRTEVQAQTSSATGLYQFIEKTWLGVVREFGSRYGLEREARLLAGGDAGGERARILELRRDPYLSAALAAEMLKRDALRLERRIGRPLTGGEVYLIHFLGPDGAERMLDQINKKPDAVAADLLPAPAAANKSIFYAADSKGLSVSEVRGKFDTMMSVRLDRYKAVKGPGGR